MASDDLKQIVAIQVASGHAVSEIAKHHNYTYSGMYKLTQTAEVQALADEHRRHLSEIYTRTWFRFAEHGEALAAGMLEDAFDGDHPKQFEARKYCLDQLAPAKNTVNHSGQIDIRVGVEAEVLLGLTQSFNRISEVRGPAHLSEAGGGALHHLQDGRETIPDVEATQEDGGPPPEHVRTHDNGDLTHPSTPLDLKHNEAAQRSNNQLGKIPPLVEDE